MSLASLLSTSGYFIVNKTLCKKLGLTSAAVIGELYSRYSYLADCGKLVDDGYFYYIVETLRENVGITVYEQRRVINSLCEQGILTTKWMGVPAKRYFKINDEKVAELLNLTELIYPKNNTENITKTNTEITYNADSDSISSRCENFEHQVLNTGGADSNTLGGADSNTLGGADSNTIYNNIYNINKQINRNSPDTKSICQITQGAKSVAPTLVDKPASKKTRKTKRDFGDMFFRISGEFNFSEDVVLALEKFGNVLTEGKAGCTQEGVRTQLAALSDNVKSDKDRIAVINRAIACGHATLIYSIENYTKSKGFNKAGRPSWESDKLKSGPTEEEIRARNERIARGEVEWF